MSDEIQSQFHNKGTFANIYEVLKEYPGGGVAGDYVIINGFAHYWNADRGSWLVSEHRDAYIDALIEGIHTLLSSLQSSIDTINIRLLNIDNRLTNIERDIYPKVQDELP